MRRSRESADQSPLAFGHATSLVFDSVGACTSFLARLPDRPSTFDAVGPPSGFRVRLKSVALPSVTIVAGSGSPKVVNHESPRAAVVVPFGTCASVVRVGRGIHRFSGPHHGFFIPAGLPASAESTAGSFLRLDIDVASLAAVSADRTAGTELPVDLAEPREVPLRSSGIDWLGQIRGICSAIDALGCDATVIRRTGLDDVVLRTISMMLAPDSRTARTGEARSTRGFDLDALLETIVANLSGRVTMTDLERWSGRSSRAIQLAFRDRFGVSPMRWLLDRRLDAIRGRLLSADGDVSIQRIARECGMLRPGTLRATYVRRFGEKPSDTRNFRRA